MAKALEKRLEAETVTLLKSLLEMELRRVREEQGFDIALFVGVDARIFASSIPDQLEPAQYGLLNLVKANLPAICAQLTNEAMQLSLTQYEEGVLVITQVGSRAFLVLLAAGRSLADLGGKASDLQVAATVMKHVFEQRPPTGEVFDGYDEATKKELQRLSRQLFVEKFEETAQYRRNIEILKYIKEQVTKSLGVGAVDEALIMSFNEVGTTAPYMKDKQWLRLLDLLVEKVRESGGDVLADRCAQEWIPEVKQKLKAFV